MRMDDTFWFTRGAARRNHQCLPVVHGITGAIEPMATGRIDHDVCGEITQQDSLGGLRESLIDHEDGIVFIPLSTDCVDDAVGRGEVEGHELAHSHSVGWVS